MDYTQELDPRTGKKLTLCLYKAVHNMPELCEKLKSLPCAVLKANLIADPFHVIVAANKAATASKLKTHSVHTEILLNLSPHNNISQCYTTFGVSPEYCGTVLIAMIHGLGTSLQEEIIQHVNGEQVDIKLLKEYTNLDDIRKCYKFSVEKPVDTKLLVSRIACKDVL